jgi:ABC-type antimicrobial peptide transport system permease subunit
MTGWTWLDWLKVGVGVFIAVFFALVIGPAYIRPLPTWLQLAIAIAGGCIIGALALYARRRARNTSPPGRSA